MSERARLFVILVGLGSIIAYGHIILKAITTSTLYPISVPFFYWGDRFMDFFNVVYDSQHDPYPNGALYLPFNILLASAFSHLADYSKSPFMAREQLGGLVGLVAMIMPAVLLVFRIAKEITASIGSKALRYNKYVIAACLIASYPFIFAIVRGNFILLTFVFFGLFLFWYEKYRIPALTCLALAICMKYYLVLFLFGIWKRYSEMAFVVAVIVVLNLVAVFVGQYFDFYLMLNNLGVYDSVPAVQITAFGGSAYNWVYTVILKCGASAMVPDAKAIYSALGALLGAFLVYLIVKRTSDFYLRNLCLLLVAVLIPIQSSNAYVYILLIPFVPYLIADVSPSRNWHLLLVGLILISKHYFVVIAEPYGPTFLNLCENALITPILSSVLLISLLAAPRKGRSNSGCAD